MTSIPSFSLSLSIPQSIVAKYGSQFRGNSQHDALEFLLWLLDRVHEDANSSLNNNSNNGSSNKTKASTKVSGGTGCSGTLCSSQPGSVSARVAFGVV